MDPLVRVGEDLLNLFINLCRFLFTVVFLGRPGGIEKQPAPLFSKVRSPSSRAHAVLRDHTPGHIGGLLQIILRTSRDISEDEVLCNPAAQQDTQAVFQF